MTTTIRDLMTTNLVCLDADASVLEAARAMKDSDVGDVLVTKQGKLCGLVTDRDIVVRCLGDNQDPRERTLESICSQDPVSLGADADPAEAVRLMKKHAVRRVPIVEGDRPIGIVSLGDLAADRDPKSALGKISTAEANG